MKLALVLAFLAGAAAAQEPPYADTATEVCLTRADGYAAQLSCMGRSAAVCMDTPAGRSAPGRIYCLDRERDFWDRTLADTYRTVLTRAREHDAEIDAMSARAPNQPKHAVALREMQQSWTEFRDAACGYEAATWGGGTGTQAAVLRCLMRQTARHALALRRGRV